MTSDKRLPEDLYALFDDLCDGSISEADAARLDQLLHDDPDARWEYLCYMDVHAGLGLAKIEDGSENTEQKAETISSLPSPASLGDVRPILPSPASLGDIMASLPSPASGRGAGGEGGLQPENVAGGQWPAASEANPIDLCTANEPERPENGPNSATNRFIIQANINQSPIPNFPVLSTDSLSPVVLDLSNSPLAPRPSPLYIAHPFLFSNLFALLIMAIGIFGAWIYQIDVPQQIAHSARPASSGADKKLDDPKNRIEFVGHITGMFDVHWADLQTSTIVRANVPLGRKYALASGLMEITYDTGATVILQGPCTYQVDSRDGGYLAAGKLTARLEKKGLEKVASGRELVASGQWLVASEADEKSQNPEIPKSPDFNPQSQITKSQILNPSSSPAPVFAVRTPTVTVTDLGTEFTVYVKPDQSSEVSVIRGSVETARDSRTGGNPVCERLVAGESIRFATITDPPMRIHSRSGRVLLSPDIKAALLQAQTARASQMLLMPTGLVASAYQRIWDADGKQLAKNDRQAAFRVVTDRQFGQGENGSPARSCFDTYDSHSSSSQTDFVGLTYSGCARFDRIKVFLGRQSKEGGIWREMPRVFILKAPMDTGSVPPESDSAHWRELSLHSLYGASFDTKPCEKLGEVIELLLTSVPEVERIGYGWALGGVAGNGKDHYISITELRAYGISLPDPNPNQGANP